MRPKNLSEADLRTKVAAMYRRKAECMRTRFVGIAEGDFERIARPFDELADRLDAGEPVTVLGSDVEYLAGLRFQELPDWVVITSEGEIRNV